MNSDKIPMPSGLRHMGKNEAGRSSNVAPVLSPFCHAGTVQTYIFTHSTSYSYQYFLFKEHEIII